MEDYVPKRDRYVLLFDEANVMREFSHPNVLPLIGVALFHNEPVILMPFMQNADLISYLRSPNNSPTVKNLIQFAIQIANGNRN